MGQSYSDSLYTVSDARQAELNDGTWAELFVREIYPNYVIKVSLNEDAYCNPIHNKYVIKLKSTTDSTMALALLFPNNPDIKRRIMWSQNYVGRLSALSRDINERIKESLNRKDQFGIICGNNCYHFSGIEGQMYLLWAEHVNIKEHNRSEARVESNIPVLVETNGQMSIRNVFVFLEKHDNPLNITNVKLELQPELWCCDMDPRNIVTTSIHTVSNKEANAIVKAKVPDSLRFLKDEEQPFHSGWTSDKEEEQEVIELQIDSARVRDYDLKIEELK